MQNKSEMPNKNTGIVNSEAQSDSNSTNSVVLKYSFMAFCLMLGAVSGGVPGYMYAKDNYDSTSESSVAKFDFTVGFGAIGFVGAVCFLTILTGCIGARRSAQSINANNTGSSSSTSSPASFFQPGDRQKQPQSEHQPLLAPSARSNPPIN